MMEPREAKRKTELIVEWIWDRTIDYEPICLTRNACSWFDRSCTTVSEYTNKWKITTSECFLLKVIYFLKYTASGQGCGDILLSSNQIQIMTFFLNAYKVQSIFDSLPLLSGGILLSFIFLCAWNKMFSE